MKNLPAFRSFVIIILIVVLAFSCTDRFKSIIEDYGYDTDTALADTSIILSGNQEDQIQFEGIEVIVPAGLVPSGTQLSIKEYDSTDFETLDDYYFGRIFDIKIAGFTEFSEKISIQIPYDFQKYKNGFESLLAAAWFDEENSDWRPFHTYEPDTINHVISTIFYGNNPEPIPNRPYAPPLTPLPDVPICCA